MNSDSLLFSDSNCTYWIKGTLVISCCLNKKLCLFFFCLSFEVEDITHTPLIRKISAFIIYLYSLKMQSLADRQNDFFFVLFIPNTRLEVSFTLFISFCGSRAGAVSHCLHLYLWLMFTGHSNTLNSLVRKGALAGVRYCRGTQGAVSMGRQRNLASVW